MPLNNRKRRGFPLKRLGQVTHRTTGMAGGIQYSKIGKKIKLSFDIIVVVE
jgi:hypothetical protein